mmetsp:Transcript_18680/g.27043  ORF Transcript_18680/g.27043 Transcript_18680/m.27043 type:complete len:251 (+) Transcript_18680:107-859(+)
MTQRFASNMVFISLLLSAEIAVLFSPSAPADTMRERLKNSEYDTVDFYAGLALSMSIFLSLSALVATFTAWAIISSISDSNAHCILRSSIGLHATQLPSRLIVSAIGAFLIWNILFLFILLPKVWAIIVTVMACTLYMYIVSIYSALGRLVMFTKAMAGEPIFKKDEEESLPPYDLYTTLLEKAQKEKKRSPNVMLFYRTRDGDTANGHTGGESVRNSDEENSSLFQREAAQDSNINMSPRSIISNPPQN